MPTVLVVDDSAVDRERVKGLLRASPELTVEFASNGAGALQRVAEVPPDLVVTDLMMPEMDGLELVARMVSQYPLIPVILMTGRGNEQIAVQALQAGASSYVPKRSLASLLLETIHHVLEAAQEVRSEIRLMNCLTRTEAFFSLANDVTMISPLVNYVHRTVRAIGLCDEAGAVRVCVALEEAITNAMFHGNLEISSDIRVADDARYRRLVDQRAHSPPSASERWRSRRTSRDRRPPS
jgi:CheY-like chemotaxis protein